MKVLQLIDSLEAGGAERMAVNLANALSEEVEGSYLISTRTEGILKDTVDESVSYQCLNKRSKFDLIALYKLYRWVKKEQINILHTHSTSFFFGAFIKIMHPKLKLIWHDHYGQSEMLNKRPYKVLRFCSIWFDLVFCVNSKLVEWNIKHLYKVPIELLTNFVLPPQNKRQDTHLNGAVGKRIVCLANLRPQKDHFTLLEAFQNLHKEHPEWSLHLVGKDFEDDYANRIKSYIKDSGLEDCVYVYGSRPDSDHILSQCEIGLLSSVSEGLPLALLEYGYYGLAVIATDVGDCHRVIKNNETGQLIMSSNVSALHSALLHYIENADERKTAASQLRKQVQQQFSKAASLQTVLQHYNRILTT